MNSTLSGSESPESLWQAMEDWRRRIDALDLEILQLLNERARCACQIGALKKRLGLPLYTPEREAEVMRNVVQHNPGPLSAEAVRRLYERIIDESRRLERESHDG
ncbi:MAG: chorismate mutase [Bacteroidetes bacterium]|nr:chorismate mutase [Rhodothermia bacterium]MCS7155594.1 chorismate mutase [Bacteroidota bacterium]MCX7906452.1 chorismate mutase [Bacteroidota bacterium]MDW8137266.1 chorismate mutase [Bacteroidota bacterium]MDW8284864.1 chorismate mutase [Bacteroidota bacterium]